MFLGSISILTLLGVIEVRSNLIITRRGMDEPDESIMTYVPMNYVSCRGSTFGSTPYVNNENIPLPLTSCKIKSDITNEPVGTPLELTYELFFTDSTRLDLSINAYPNYWNNMRGVILEFYNDTFSMINPIKIRIPNSENGFKWDFSYHWRIVNTSSNTRVLNKLYVNLNQPFDLVHQGGRLGGGAGGGAARGGAARQGTTKKEDDATTVTTVAVTTVTTVTSSVTNEPNVTTTDGANTVKEPDATVTDGAAAQANKFMKFFTDIKDKIKTEFDKLAKQNKFILIGAIAGCIVLFVIELVFLILRLKKQRKKKKEKKGKPGAFDIPFRKRLSRGIRHGFQQATQTLCDRRICPRQPCIAQKTEPKRWLIKTSGLYYKARAGTVITGHSVVCSPFQMNEKFKGRLDDQMNEKVKETRLDHMNEKFKEAEQYVQRNDKFERARLDVHMNEKDITQLEVAELKNIDTLNKEPSCSRQVNSEITVVIQNGIE